MSSRKRIVICGGGAIGTAMIAYFKARQACFRPVTEDGLPLIGAVPGIDGAYVATGHTLWGMLNAACRRMTPRVCTAVQADACHPQVERLLASNRYRTIEGVLTEHGST
jgi:hypothetical protein